MTQTHKPRIGITLGDYNGIGPEVVLKALSDNRILNLVTPVVYGSAKVFSFYKKLLNLDDINYSQVRNKGQYTAKSINVINCWADDALEIIPGKASTEGGKAAYIALKQAALDIKEGLIDALVTAPVDKHTIHSDEFPFSGHTGFLTNYFEVSDSLMFMISEKLRVGLVTEHIPIKEVASALTTEKIDSKLKVMDASLRKDFGISKPKIAVLGLNPHAGDSGLLGQEEDQIIRPVIADQKNKGRLVYGPFPADGFFATGNYTKYDGVLAMYHDQGLVPFKTIAFGDGVNFTAGLPIIRTSPDHGTAYAIAGKNQADEGSLREAIYQAVEIFKLRTQPSKEK
jgi:4-hydroxythreonine-4-phosphate dehydrogenase